MEDSPNEDDQQKVTPNNIANTLPSCYVLLAPCPSPRPATEGSPSPQDDPPIISQNPAVAAIASDSTTKTQSPKKRTRLTPEERQYAYFIQFFTPYLLLLKYHILIV